MGLRLLVVLMLSAISFPEMSSASGQTWALLVAGSNTWWNYRHQADICHAYHVIRSAGVPEDRIVTMMYDDIAQNEQNPNKGVIINQPGGGNVYAGVRIDYRGVDVTPQNFLKILQGDKAAMAGIGTGRVIESDSGDNIFLNFADHGGTGLLCFPNEYLYANDLHTALDSMVKNKKFNKMVVYIEACEAGSMFDKILEENDNIFVSTASAPDESSWGWYCDDPLGTCLGDLYSIRWMEHMDQLVKAGLTGSETLFHQYQWVRSAVNKSHVQIYGDFSLGFDTVSTYLGSGQKYRNSPVFLNQITPMKFDKEDGVSTRDIPIHVTKNKLNNAKSALETIMYKERLHEMTQKRTIADKTIDEIVGKVTEGDTNRINEIEGRRYILTNKIFSCYKNLIDGFNEHCFNTYQNTYLVKHFYKFANLCTMPWTSKDNVIAAMSSICNQEHRLTFGIV